MRIAPSGQALTQAGGVKTVVAAHGKMEALRERIIAGFDFSDAPPADIGGVVVLFVAGHFAAFAADALGHVEVEAVLLAFGWQAQRNAGVHGAGAKLDKTIGATGELELLSVTRHAF